MKFALMRIPNRNEYVFVPYDYENFTEKFYIKRMKFLYKVEIFLWKLNIKYLQNIL